MPSPIRCYHPSLETGAPTGESSTQRISLYDSKDDFIGRVAPIGMAAIYFGAFSLAPQDSALSRQALYKLSFAYRHFLQPAGIRIFVQRQTAILSGSVSSRPIVTMAHILARQIEGIRQVRDEAEVTLDGVANIQAVQLLFATDQTLRAGVVIGGMQDRIILSGQVTSAAQKSWAEQLAESVGSAVDSRLTVANPAGTVGSEVSEPASVDDESLQALVLLRLRLVRETEHLPLKAKANRGIVSLQGKVRTEAARQRAENLTRSTIGLRELRSTISLIA